MGMAASQARFLGLTARKNNVEYEGQQINQQRTALSSASASHYTNLLGLSVPICPSVEDFTQTSYSFGDGSLQNSITSLIALSDGSYKVSYLSQYTDDFAVVAAGATSVVNHNDKYMVGGTELRPLANDLYWHYVIREESVTYRLNECGTNYNYKDNNGENHTLVPATYDIITSLIGPEPDLSDYNVGPLITNYKSTQCYSGVGTSTNGIGHMEHNLCRLMWSDGTDSITSSDGVTLTKLPVANDYYSLTTAGWRTSTDQTSVDLQKALKTYYPDMYQELVDTYIDAILYLNKYGSSTTDSTGMLINPNWYTLSSTEYSTTDTPTSGIVSSWNGLWSEISQLDYSETFDSDHRAWQKEYDSYAGKYVDASDYTKVYTLTERVMYYEGNDPYLKSLTSEQLEELYYEEVEYRDMLEKEYGVSAEGWFVRYKENTSTGDWEPTFYRGDDLAEGFRDKYQNIRSGFDTYKIGSKAVQTEIKGQKAYLEQDSTGRYINITFVDEEGVKGKTYALSTSTVIDNAAYEDAMNQYEYDKSKYDQSIKVINTKIAIIQVEDKDLEVRLKQLDTEQKAITNELEAVQKVIEKNVESSFKTFG